MPGHDSAQPSGDASPTSGPGLRRPRAVLWDMDGTLIDSEQYWIAAETELLAGFGIPWTHEQGLALVGSHLPRAAAFFQGLGVGLEVPEIIDFLISRVSAAVVAEVPWQPGAIAALARLREAGIPCALVTMSFRSLADAFVDRAPAGTFDAVVAGDDVTHGKPHPEAYLTAADLLGVPVEDCVVVEDSPSGVGAALACGAVPVGIEVMVPLPEDPRLNRVRSLDSLTPEFYDRVLGGEVIDLLAAPTA